MLRLDEINGGIWRTQFSQLLDQAFSLPAGAHYLEDFPIWDESVSTAGPRLVRIGIFDDDHLVGCAGVRIAELKVSSERIPVGLIGAVATHPDYRSRGLASQAVEFAVKWARARGAAGVFLWGSEHSFYQRLGFMLAGRQMQLALSEMALPAAASSVGKGWTPGIFDALKKREGGLALQDSDRTWYAAHRHVDWYWLGEALAPKAYAAIGRGIDLSGIIHEWGGEREALTALFTAMKKSHPDVSLLGHPEILRSYRLLPAQEPLEQGLALVQVFDTKVLSEKILSSTWIWGLDAV